MKGGFEVGDRVLLLGEKDSMIITLQDGMTHLGRGRGAVSSNRFTQSFPGDRIRLGSGEYVLLVPDMLDHLQHIKRGAQMILPGDSDAIVTGLALRSGSRVIEGGAGSGGLTIALLNAVSPGGRVMTIEMREDHLKNCSTNVRGSGLEGCFEGRIGDIYEEWEKTDIDAAALDVPEPERALGPASRALRPGGRICCFVPTMNQVERVFLAMKELGFSEPRAEERIIRELSVKKGAVRPASGNLSHTGYLVFARWIG